MGMINRLFRSIIHSPIVWGLMGTAAFYGLIFGGPLNFETLHRYFTHHPVEYGEATLFAVGLAALVLRMIEVAAQRVALPRFRGLGVPPADRDVAESCQALSKQLDRLPAQQREHYYPQRLCSGLRYLEWRGSSDGLSDELKFLADADASRAHSRYALFRVIVWAIPILGFLGTVIGITLALNAIDPKNPDESMLKVITGLGLKFDTTAVALSLSMVLMFVHFFADRGDARLLEEVDRRTEAELMEWFPCVPSGPDGQVVALRRMTEAIAASSEELIQRQSQLWQASMDAAAERWSRMAESAGQQLTKAIAEALAQSVAGHAQHLAAAEQATAEQSHRHWDRLAQVQAQHVQALAAIQNAVVHQAEVLHRAVEAAGEVVRLEDALNRNLTTLAGAKHFEQTVLGLAATINLLNARLSDSSSAPPIQLESARRTAKAA